MFGIEKNFQNLMEQVYGPLGKKEQEECDRIAKKLVDNAIEEVKKMTDEIDISKVLIEGDTATIMGVKYKRIEEPQSFYDKLWELLKTKLGDSVECDEMADRVRDLIREHIPEPVKNNFMSEYLLGYNAAYEEKVAQEPEPEEEPEKLKTLFQMLNDKNNHPETCAFVCNIVKRWMSQYTHNVMTGEYLKGYEECLTVLEENLK